MSNPAKVKGTRFESLVVSALGGFFAGLFGLDPRRVPPEGYQDSGDVHGVSPVILQCKAWANLASALREGVTGAVAQAARAGEDYGVAVVKRPRAAIGDAYAVLRLQDLARLLLRLRRAEALLDDEARAAHLAASAGDLLREFPRC